MKCWKGLFVRRVIVLLLIIVDTVLNEMIDNIYNMFRDFKQMFSKAYIIKSQVCIIYARGYALEFL